MKYYIETECGGPRTGGGGCGAPLSFYSVSKEEFDETKGRVSDNPFSHRPDECNFEGGVVKLTFRACSDCRE